MTDIAALTVDSIGPTRLKQIVCPKCSWTTSRWFHEHGERRSGYRRLGAHLEQEHSPTPKLADDWRIVLVRDDWYELQCQDPVKLQWHCMFDAPSAAHCKRAYDLFQEGERPGDWEDMDLDY